MSIHRLPSGAYRARLMIDGVRYSATAPTAEAAADWEAVIRGRAVTGGLPRRITVAEYAARWMTTYATAPTATRVFHQGNLDRHVLPTLGPRLVGDVTLPTSSGCSTACGSRCLPRPRTRSTGPARRSSTPPWPTTSCFAARCGPRSTGPDVSARPTPSSNATRRACSAAPQGLASRHRPAPGRSRGSRRGGRRAHPARRRPASRPGDHPPPSLPRHDPRHQEPPHAHPGSAGRHAAHDRAAPERCRGGAAAAGARRSRARRRPVLAALADPDLDRSPRQLLGLRQALAKACRSVGLPHISSHTLRHTYVSWMIDEGHSADKVAFWTGDTSDTVRTVYAHMLEASSAPAAASIDQALADIR